MHTLVQCVRVLALGIVAIALLASLASASVLMRVNSFLCNNEIGPASVTVTETRAGLQFRFKAKGLPPNTDIQCGFSCGQVEVGGQGGSCGSSDARGNWSFTAVFPPETCFGLIPAFSVATIGLCVPGIAVP